MASGQLRVVRGNVLLGRRPRPEVGIDPDHRPGRALQADDADDVAQGVASVRFKHGVRPAVEVALEFLLPGGHRQSIDAGCDRPGHRCRAQTIVVDSRWFDSGRSRPLPGRFFPSRGRGGYCTVWACSPSIRLHPPSGACGGPMGRPARFIRRCRHARCTAARNRAVGGDLPIRSPTHWDGALADGTPSPLQWDRLMQGAATRSTSPWDS